MVKFSPLAEGNSVDVGTEVVVVEVVVVTVVVVVVLVVVVRVVDVELAVPDFSWSMTCIGIVHLRELRTRNALAIPLALGHTSIPRDTGRRTGPVVSSALLVRATLRSGGAC